MKKTILTLALAGTAVIASADTVNLVYNGQGTYGQTINVSLSGGLFFQSGASSSAIWAGQLDTTIDGTAFDTYCTELTQWAGSGVFECISVEDAPRPGSGMGQVKADAIYRLFNATNGAADIDTNAKAAAFQAVIWEIVYDYDGTESTMSTAGGDVQMSGIGSGLFNTYRGIAAGAGDASPTLIALTNDTKQDVLLIVPLPGAAAMAGLGLAGIAARRRRA